MKYVIVSLMPLSNSLELRAEDGSIWYVTLPLDKRAAEYKVGSYYKVSNETR